ncbi:hypothetical protein DSO57_1001755 [Entomophthora muscae]|uniref:Uncharacterized protein n=1 Tax=Entomophthora muscae TaxID=34485 RepID=A0ACC2T8T2_9FUNG|nr:hypothetical protein DSO57_1001755 [Entomophthora muscae]
MYLIAIDLIKPFLSIKLSQSKVYQRLMTSIVQAPETLAWQIICNGNTHQEISFFSNPFARGQDFSPQNVDRTVIKYFGCLMKKNPFYFYHKNPVLKPGQLSKGIKKKI